MTKQTNELSGQRISSQWINLMKNWDYFIVNDTQNTMNNNKYLHFLQATKNLKISNAWLVIARWKSFDIAYAYANVLQLHLITESNPKLYWPPFQKPSYYNCLYVRYVTIVLRCRAATECTYIYIVARTMANYNPKPNTINRKRHFELLSSTKSILSWLLLRDAHQWLARAYHPCAMRTYCIWDCALSATGIALSNTYN